jgi:hypothetical protein
MRFSILEKEKKAEYYYIFTNLYTFPPTCIKYIPAANGDTSNRRTFSPSEFRKDVCVADGVVILRE